MKSSPLRRGKALERRTELRAGAPLEGGGRLRRRGDSGALRLAKLTVKKRSRGLCESPYAGACGVLGEHAAVHVHHLAGRGWVGCHDPSNLIHLCDAAHRWTHSVAADTAIRVGLRRRKPALPSIGDADEDRPNT